MKNELMPIVLYGNDALRIVTEPVESIEDVKLFIEPMMATMKNAHGIGLAAPQVNILKRFFVCSLGAEPIVVINPVIRKSRMTQNSSEGCLSIPMGGIAEKIVRHDLIDVEFFDINMNRQRMKLSGYNSRVFQHEYDHLDGVLFIDHMTAAGREMVLYRLEQARKENRFRIHYDMIMPDGTTQKADG